MNQMLKAEVPNHKITKQVSSSKVLHAGVTTDICISMSTSLSWVECLGHGDYKQRVTIDITNVKAVVLNTLIPYQ